MVTSLEHHQKRVIFCSQLEHMSLGAGPLKNFQHSLQGQCNAAPPIEV
jgi:hypothetical protein